MHCNGCGCILHEGEQFCPGCGKPVLAPAPVPATPSPLSTPPMYVVGAHPSGKATASLICGIFFFIFPLPIVAVVLGHMALSEIKRSAGRLIGEGRAIAGLVLGYFGLSVVPIVLIIAAIAIPNLLRSRMAANEASAVASVRAIHTAQSTYMAEFSDVGYACELYQLGGNSQNATSVGAGVLDNLLSSGTKNGYSFRIAGCGEDGKPADKYVVYATPLQPGTTGSRSFCSDQDGEIKAVKGGNAESCMEYGTPIN